MRAQINHARRHATFNAAELRRQGYRQIGRGAFSRVFVHPNAPDVVIKIGRRYNRRCGYVDGFPYFASQILNKEISSKFYPRIYGFQWSADGRHFWCIMKRYEKHGRKFQHAYDMSATLRDISGHSYYQGTPTARFRRALEPFADFRFVDDLHCGNVLRDHDGTPIMVDPICVKKEFEHAVYHHAHA